MLYYELFEFQERITENRYVNQLIRLGHEINRKRPRTGKQRRKVILPHDDARPRIALVTQRALMDLQWEIQP